MLANTDKLLTRNILNDAPWPEKAISWPQSRRLVDYWRLLLAPWSFKSLSEASELPNIMALLSLAWIDNKPFPVLDANDFLQQINPSNRPIVVDIGMGDAYALREMKEKEGFVTIGIGLHEINPSNASSIDLIAYSPVPKGRIANKVFNDLRGKVALVCEAYGASTYADGDANPIEALIYEGLLLAPGGTAKTIISSVLNEESDQSPIGFALQRQRLVDFFKNQLGLELVISRTYINSLLMPGTHCVDYHIEIKRPLQAVVSKQSLDELFALAKVYIGQCTVIAKKTSIGEFGAFGIRGRTYTLPGEAIQLKSSNCAQHLKSRSFRFVGKQESNPAFTFCFNAADVMSEFVIRFSEYYLNHKKQKDWHLEIDNDGCSVLLIYEGEQTNRVAAMRQAKIEMERIFPDLLKPGFESRLFKSQQAESSRNVDHSNQAVSLAGSF